MERNGRNTLPLKFDSPRDFYKHHFKPRLIGNINHFNVKTISENEMRFGQVDDETSLPTHFFCSLWQVLDPPFQIVTFFLTSQNVRNFKKTR